MKKAENGMQALGEDELEGICGGVSELKNATCSICRAGFSYSGTTAPELCSNCRALMNYCENFVKIPDLGI